MKFHKKLVVTFLTLALILGCVPCVTTEVQAAPKVPKILTIYLSPNSVNKSGAAYGQIFINGLKADQKITAIKASPKNIVSSWTYGKSSDTLAFITCIANKSGMTTLSYKIGSQQYKTRIYVKKYTNPAKFISIPIQG